MSVIRPDGTAIIGRRRKECMTRADVTAWVLEAKRQLGLTWKEIAAKIGKGSPVFYTGALLGHHALTAEEAREAGTLLKLDESAVKNSCRDSRKSRGKRRNAALGPADLSVLRNRPRVRTDFKGPDQRMETGLNSASLPLCRGA
jgi:hypothetical protein